MTDIFTIHHQAALLRSTLYHHLAEMLTYPSANLLRSCQAGDQDRNILEVLRQLPYELPWTLDTCSTDKIVLKLASEYMRVFELPIDGQPCALYGGVYTGNRREVMEELLRYYRFFGLSTNQAKDGDLPDSIPTLLEFFQFLTHKEAGAGDADEVLSIRLVQKDLLERHLTRWVPAIKSQIEQRKAPAFYRSTVNLLNEFTSAELGRLAAQQPG
ncbi:MAG: molecular chaperone TorD family protein [Gammaproteobacteria bacterium]|nr:molecular chaperone TorD family protein [Gammaproteobacteria bacterium]